ncbi:MAG: hypothetical protein JWR61_2346 [Ferruginibacter sp.]|nr:hypothetical protein [Ferruginibacter sp.]
MTANGFSVKTIKMPAEKPAGINNYFRLLMAARSSIYFLSTTSITAPNAGIVTFIPPVVTADQAFIVA